MANEILGLINSTTGVGISNADIRYTLNSTTASISGGLDSRITTINNNYATKATPTPGTYNNVIVNSQGVVTSGGFVTYLTVDDDTPYTLLTTTSSISGGFNSRIGTLETSTSGITGGLTQLDLRYIDQDTVISSVNTASSGNYTITLTDTVVYANQGNPNIYLPAVPVSNEHHWIVNIDGGEININGNGKNMWIAGLDSPSARLPADSSVHLHYNATKNKWYIL
jgi:hypothetical protein